MQAYLREGPIRRSVALLLAVPLVLSALAGCVSPSPDQGQGAPAGPTTTESTDDASSADDQQDAGDAGQSPTGPPPWLGAWPGAWPSAENRALERFTDTTGADLAVVNVYVDWNSSYSDLESSLQRIAAHGARPMITWTPQGMTTDELADRDTQLHYQDGTTVTIQEHVTAYAEGLCELANLTGEPVLLNMLPEPNGNWNAWSVGWQSQSTQPAPNTDASYKQAYMGIHDTMTRACPEPATFVWTVASANLGANTTYLGAYPGPDYVDVVGITGFNTGDLQDPGWRSFEAIVMPAYEAVTEELSQPVIISSFASVEEGGDKAAWITQAVVTLRQDMPRVQGAVWFHGVTTDPATGQQVDWRVDSSPAALEAFEQAAAGLASEA